MVIGAFPAAKLGTLLLKQISKPIANYIKHHAKTSPLFRTYICMPPAQFYNWCEVKTKMWILNLGKPVNIPVLNEAMAIELGANLLGEGVIFVIAAGVLISEYSRSSRKEAAREAAKQQEMDSLNTEMQELFFQMEEQRVQIRELLRALTELDSQVLKKPSWSSKSKGSAEESPDDPPAKPPAVLAKRLLPSENILTQAQVVENPKATSVNNSTSLLLKAVQVIESDFFSSSTHQRDIGILTVALDHLYKNVYKVPLAMY